MLPMYRNRKSVAPTSGLQANMDWINAIVQGVLLGGLYALFAAGLSLIFGVMRLVNIAHGDLIILAAYVGMSITLATGLHPIAVLPIVIVVMALIGYLLQRLILNRTLGEDILPPLLVTFGLSVIIQNSLLETYTADPQSLDAGALETASVNVLGLSLGVLPLITFALAIVVIAALQFMFYKTALGRIFRAVSDNQEIAQLMGVNRRHVFGIAMALSLAVTAIAGVLLVAQTVGAKINPGWQLLAGHIVFLLVLAIRPTGLFPRMKG